MSDGTCRSAAITAGALILMLALSAAAAPPSYTATRIAVPGGAGIGINSRGDVIGVWRNGYESYVVSSQGSVDEFPWVAAAINDSGQIAGDGPSQDGGHRHALVRTDGSVRDIHPAGAKVSAARGINASGTVVGFYQVGGAPRAFGFVFEADRHETLPSLADGSTIPVAINSNGQVTGNSYDAQGLSRAFLYTAGEMKDLGTLGGSYSHSAAVNWHGHVVGYSRTSSGVHHAFVHAGGQMSSLGTLDTDLHSFANGINDAGQIVGDSGDGWDVSHPFLYVGGAMHDLNALVVSGLDTPLTSAVAINAAGQILAVACPNCQTYLLDPLTPGKARAIEYHHAEFDHYFMTTDAAEIAQLDAGGTGWVRTGEWLDVDAAAQPATSPVCRFFSASFAPRSSHFYTPDPGECETVKRNAAWQFEGEAFHVLRPDASGVCPAGKQAVYRLYNSGIGGAPNHRYTTSRSVRDATIAKGWMPEGYGPLGVGMCV